MDGKTLLLEAKAIGEIRLVIAKRTNMLCLWEQEWAVKEARLINDFISQAGGEKAVGANEDARKRAITIMLAENKEAAAMTASIRDLKEQQRIDEARLATAIDCQRARYYLADEEWLASLEPVDQAMAEVPSA